MNLKLRLALLYSLSVLIILVSSAVTIYILAENFRKKEYSKELVIEATEAYQSFIRLNDPAAAGSRQATSEGTVLLPASETFIYNEKLQLLYSSKQTQKSYLNKAYISKVLRTKKPYTFSAGSEEAVLLAKTFQKKVYYIVAAGTDESGRRKNENLKFILIFSVVGGIVLSGFLAFLYVQQAMKPLEELKLQMEEINEDNLKQRITAPESNDELKQISNKFNAMLDRLEQAFEQRKNFVQHASHELRTPLANMLSQTESALSKNLTVEEFKKVLLSLKEDQQEMIELTNSLLILSRYEKLDQLADTTQIRIDEIIYQTVDFINQGFPDTLVTVDFDTIPENEELLQITGNEMLIKAAFKILIKNAVMFAEDLRVKISIDPGERIITLKFENIGKQLNTDEQSRLFIPFFRGENAQTKKGHGLGLSIVERIIKVHRGKIAYNAINDNLNRFTVKLPTDTR